MLSKIRWMVVLLAAAPAVATPAAAQSPAEVPRAETSNTDALVAELARLRRELDAANGAAARSTREATELRRSLATATERLAAEQKALARRMTETIELNKKLRGIEEAADARVRERTGALADKLDEAEERVAALRRELGKTYVEAARRREDGGRDETGAPGEKPPARGRPDGTAEDGTEGLGRDGAPPKGSERSGRTKAGTVEARTSRGNGATGAEVPAAVARPSERKFEALLARLDATPADDGWTVVRPRGVVFSPGGDALTYGGRLKVSEVAALINLAPPGSPVRVVGHTDSLGGLETNRNLSLRRAQSVVEALVEFYGIERDRLHAEGMGEAEPIAGNGTPKGRRQNRRIEVFVRRSGAEPF